MAEAPKRDLIVLCTGGREFEDWRFVYATLDAVHAKRGIHLVIHGACVRRLADRDAPPSLRGADRWSEEWAISREVPYLGVPAPWTLLGKRAGMVRNGTMLTLRYVPDVVIGFPGGVGTAGMIALAAEQSIATYVPFYG